MPSGGGDGGASEMRKQQLQQQADITAATKSINASFAGFNPDFYKARTQAYEDFAMPQVQQQFQQTKNRSTAQLAGQGLGNSSVANKQNEALQTALGTAEQGVANTALGQTQQLQQQVAQEQSNLVSQANAANVPSSVAQSALGAAGSFATPSAMPAVGQLFGDFANQYLGAQSAKMYSGMGSGVGGTFGTGAYSSPAMAGLSSYTSGAFNPVSYNTH